MTGIPFPTYLLKIVTFVILCQRCVSYAGRQLRDEKNVFEGYANRAKELLPNVDYSQCASKFFDSSFSPICFHNNGRKEGCPGVYPGPRLAWALRCFATTLVEGGYQVPAYVVDPPRWEGFEPEEKYAQMNRRIAGL